MKRTREQLCFEHQHQHQEQEQNVSKRQRQRRRRKERELLKKQQRDTDDGAADDAGDGTLRARSSSSKTDHVLVGKFNDRMRERCVYKQLGKPKFAALAELYPPLRALYVACECDPSLSLSLSLSRVSALTSRSCSIIDNKFGKPTIDWHDAQALLELTTTLLWHCYSIRMVMPHTVEVEQLSLGYDVHKACQRKGAVLRITCRDRRTSLSSFPLVSLLLRVCGPRSTHCWPRQCTCRLYTSSPTCLQCLPRFLGLQDNQETGRRREGKDGDIAARSAFLIHRTHIRRIIVVTRERHPLRASDCCRC